MTAGAGLAAVCAEVAGHGRLLRSWPRGADHLLVEVDVDGAVTAGQWWADPDRARSVADRTPGARVHGRLVLQPGGADQRLHGLPGLLTAPDSALVAHRPERRAVVRTGTGGEVRYVKVVRPDRLSGLLDAARQVTGLPVRTPRVVTADPGLGHLVTAALPGHPLHELLDTPLAVPACAALGAALAALHALPAPAGAPVHDATAEAAVLHRWAGLARHWGVDGVPDPEPLAAELTGGAPCGRALLHRDLHDRQVLVDADGTIGVLDLDLLAVGEPALDLANLLVHLELRQQQGRVAHAGPLQAAVLAGYAPSAAVSARLPVHQAATRLRLAAVYGFRPGAQGS